MNTNKKINDSESGWLLCPSKRNPGKFYYFNVVTGESVWSCDIDNKSLKENNVQKLSDNCHKCHEPTDDGPTSSTNGPSFRPYYEPRSPYVQPMPIFGQTPYPKYVPDQDLIPNIVWAPIQLPVFGHETKKPLIDKITQTFDTGKCTEQPELKLCSRCKCHENPIFSFEETDIQKPLRTSTPKKSFNFEPCRETQNDRSIGKPILPFSPEKNTNSNLLSSLSHDNKVANAINTETNEENLEKSDLRLFLIAKRRKSVDAGVTGPIERKKIFELKQPIPKKRVTFNMSNIEKVDENHTNNLSDDRNINTNQSYNNKGYEPKPELPKNESFMFSLENYEKSKYLLDGVQSDTWFLVVDTDVLLLDYEIIDNLVLSDTKCKLLIPFAVRSDIEALCIGDCEGQQRVTNARKITRRLVTPPNHYIIQPRSENEGYLVTTESVLKCCVQASYNHRVVLITNDPYLQAKANLLNITNYKLNDIKYNLNQNKPLEFIKLKINSYNHVNENDDVIQENSLNSEVQKQLIPKVNSIFDCENPVNTECKSIKINETDTTADINQIVKNLKSNKINLTKPVNINNPFMSKEINLNIPSNLITINTKNKFESNSNFKNITSTVGQDSCATENRTNDFEILSLEDDTIERFTVKDDIMSEKLSSRMDEWICTYTQIMEDVLHALLQINSDCIRKAPLSLQDTFHSIEMIYAKNTKIKTIVKKLSNLLDKCTTKNGKLILAPDDFMTILGYGVLLVQELKSTQQHSKELKDAANSISSLLNNIESDISVDDPERFKTAPVSRSEYDDQKEIRSNFVKDPSTVVDYLKKHYVQWAEFAGKVDDVNGKTTCRNDYNILRTSGKHLSKLKIHSSKNISLNTNEEITDTSIPVNHINIKNQVPGQHFENLQKPFIDTSNYNESSMKRTTDYNQENNKLKDIYNNSSDGPKNITIQCEKKIKESLDLDALDYSELINTNDFGEKSKINDKIVKNNNNHTTIPDIDNSKLYRDIKNIKIESFYEISDDTSISHNDGNILKTYLEQNKHINLKYAKINQNITKVNGSIPKFNENVSSFYDNDPKNDQLARDNNTNDSGFENDSTYAYSAVKIFFSEVCSTFRLVHKSIEKFRLIINKGELSDLKKKEFHYKASKSLEHFDFIIQHLKNIINRESTEETILKGLLLKSGLEASMDKRITHYRQVAIKFLEQAQILELGLRAIVSVTIGDFVALSTIEESATSKHFNIFE